VLKLGAQMTKDVQKHKIQELINSIVGTSLHAKQILSLSNAVQGIVHAASLALSVIGQALAELQGLDPKHATKQVDRLFNNSKINLVLFFSNWVYFLTQNRTKIVVSLDWTDFDKDDHCTLVFNLITSHGRATPMLWTTYQKSKLKNNRGKYERELISLLKSILPSSCEQVIILADRGFSDVDFYEFIKSIGFDFVIRFKKNVYMTVDGRSKQAQEWLLNKAKLYKNVGLTLSQYEVPSVVCVHDKKMKDSWYLASSLGTTSMSEITARVIIKYYGYRFSCEENFRDVKDIRFGMGLSSVRIKNAERRDRILMASAIAVSLLTLLGAAGEAIGLDRLLKVNTAKKRTHSLFTQGYFYFRAMVNYKIERFELLIKKYAELLREHIVFNGLFSIL
jgi:hypothetical protein